MSHEKSQRLVSHLRGIYGPSTQMDMAQLVDALVIAEGWPDGPAAVLSQGNLVSEGEKF